MSSLQNLHFKADDVQLIKCFNPELIDWLVYKEHRPAKKFLGFTINKEKPAGWYDVYGGNDYLLSEERLKEWDYLFINNRYYNPPRVRVYLRNAKEYEQFKFDSVEEMNTWTKNLIDLTGCNFVEVKG